MSRKTLVLFAMWTAVVGSIPATRVRAEPPGPSQSPPAGGGSSLESSVARVAEAFTPRDADAARAAVGSIDPWLVVDELMGRSEAPAARWFAELVEGGDAAALREYASRRLREPSDARARLAAAEQLVRSEAWDAAARALEAGDDLSDDVLRVRWLGTRAAALAGGGSRRDAAASHVEAGGIARRLGWRPEAARHLQAAGALFAGEYEYEAALDAWRRLRELYAETQDAVRETRTLANLATLSRRLGDFRRAVSLYDEALSRAPAKMSAVELATVRLYRGECHARLGEFPRAFDDELAALAAFQEAGDVLSLSQASASLAELHGRIGDRGGATQSARRALAVLEGLSDPRREKDQRWRRAIAGATLGVCLMESGEEDEAASRFTAAREEFTTLGDRANAGAAHANLAELRLRQRRWEDARTLATEARTTLDDAHVLEGVLNADGARADAEAGLGHAAEAERIHTQVLDRAERLGFQSIVLEQCGRLGRVRLSRGDAAGALESCRRGIRVLAALFGDLADGQRVGARGWFATLFQTALQAAARRNDDAEFFRFVEMSRAGSLLDALSNPDSLRSRRIDPTLEAARVDAARTITAARQRYAAASGDREKARAATAEIDQALHRLDEAIAAIQRENRAAAHVLHPVPDALADVKARLAADEAIVEYSVVGDHLLALAVAKDRSVRIDLGSVDLIRPAAGNDAWQRESGDAPAALAAARDALSRANELVWAPVLKALPSGVRRIAVSPDGPVALLPFGALATGAEAPFVTYIPSATTLGILRSDADRRGKGVLALGISAYQGRDAAGEARKALWGRFRPTDLPLATGEATAVGDREHLLLDEHASETAFRRLLPTSARWSAIHFACHGLVDAEHPGLSALALWPSTDDDGFLTALEIFQTDAPSDLVFLSACRTADGAFAPGEGIVGLVRAFFFAGTPRVVASLWPADDAASAVFATGFHEAWKGGRGAATAFRAGLDRVRADPKYAHPRYWAGWVLWGVGD